MGGTYLYTIEVKKMLKGNPKVGNNTKKRFIRLDLVIGKDAREAKKDDNIFLNMGQAS